MSPTFTGTDINIIISFFQVIFTNSNGTKSSIYINIVFILYESTLRRVKMCLVFKLRLVKMFESLFQYWILGWHQQFHFPINVTFSFSNTIVAQHDMFWSLMEILFNLRTWKQIGHIWTQTITEPWIISRTSTELHQQLGAAAVSAHHSSVNRMILVVWWIRPVSPCCVLSVSYPPLSSLRVKELCELLSYWNGSSFICRSQVRPDYTTEDVHCDVSLCSSCF